MAGKLLHAVGGTTPATAAQRPKDAGEMRPLRTYGPRVVCVAVLTLLSVGCGAAPGDVEVRSTDAALATGPSASDLIHIHRLQEVPGRKALYVATHTGLFQVDGEDVEAVSAAGHDLMGFTVAGPGDLLASGHPDLRVDELMVDGKPPLLGLAHSRDGQGWEPLSLLGDVDFHALVSAHDKVYGLDSQTGALMVSSDRRTWETRSKGLPFTDIAVSPDDPDSVLAAGSDGVANSSDGGRSWKQVSSQPAAYLSWTAEGLFAVSPDGTISRSADAGSKWEALGSVGGPPAALLVTADAIYTAVHEVGIMRSTDGGRTFDILLGTG